MNKLIEWLAEGDRTKIAVPIMAESPEHLNHILDALPGQAFDLVEFRADHFKRWADDQVVLDALSKVREHTAGKALIFTFRSSEEGGVCPISPEGYRAINRLAISSSLVDLVDIELAANRDLRRELTDFAHARSLAVIYSQHDFQGTADRSDLVNSLERMLAEGADLVKIASMPGTKEDVRTLLEAGALFHRDHPEVPLIAMSMGDLGRISRVVGSLYGSCISFAAFGVSSAPGQLDIGDLSKILQALEGKL